MSSKPSPADIQTAIIRAEAGDWLGEPDALCWQCELFNPQGELVGDGHADTPELAMGLAWLACWSPDALVYGHVEPGSVPFEVPDGWRFELVPP